MLLISSLYLIFYLNNQLLTAEIIDTAKTADTAEIKKSVKN